jgi:ActR/RegA family two-component response regulator/anti-sigma regulatory factor (Ser/Thr protein kinase)
MRDPSLRVLLIDPEDTSAHALGTALERRGLPVRAARDLERGLQLEPNPRVIVAELAGLDGHGAALLAERRARGEAPSLLVLLNRAEPAAVRRAVRMGAVDILCKPIRIEELVDAIDGLARQAPAERGVGVAPGVLRRTYPATPPSVERLARDLAAFALRAGVGPACRARIASACAEIAHNACHHAFAHSAGSIDLEATFDEQDIVVTIADRGEGFDSSAAMASAFEHGFEHGLGRAAALAEGLDVHSVPGEGSRVVLRFCALRADFDGPEQLDLSEHDFLLPEASRGLLGMIRTGSGEGLVLSPALAVLVGRLLAGPDPRRALSMALWS